MTSKIAKNHSLGVKSVKIAYSKKWANVAFLARTHGQPASPSTLGKEFKVFAARLDREISILKKVKPLAKFSGATGNYHTFSIVDSKINWSQINNKFIRQFLENL